MGEVREKPSFNGASSKYSSNKVADIDTELTKIRENEVSSLKAALLEKDVLVKKLEFEVEKGKESEKKLIDSLEETKVEIASLKERSYHSQDSSEDDEDDDNSDIESMKIEMESTKEILGMAQEVAEASSLKVTELLEEMKSIKNELRSATDAEITSKKAMDDLAFALKEVATDCGQTKEKLSIAETELESARLESQEVKKEAELFKNTSERLRIEAEESLLAWNGKESVFVSCIKRGEDEKNSLLDENSRLLEALVAAENQTKKAKEENHKVRDILKQAINEANVAKEAAIIARTENSNLKDALLDKEEEIEFALKEVERVKVNEAVANDNVKKLKKLLSEVEVAMEEEKHRQDSMQKKDSKKEKTDQSLDKKMIGKTCSFSLMKLAHNQNHKHRESIEEETKALNARNHHENNNTSEESSEANSPDSDSNLFKGSIFDVTETPKAATAQTHHKRRSSCTFLEEVKTINPEELDENHLEEGELNDKAVAKKKKAFIRRFGNLLVRRKSMSFSHKKDSSTDSADKQQPPQTPTSPSPPQLSPSPEP